MTLTHFKTKNMVDLSYTAQGNFDQNGRANITVCIPAEHSQGAYTTELFNLSKQTPSGILNVIFCHFKDQKNIQIHFDAFDYQMNFDLKNLNVYPKAVAIDAQNADALFIFFHCAVFEASDRDDYFAQIERIYADIKTNGNQTGPGIINTHQQGGEPRRVGMSLVIR